MAPPPRRTVRGTPGPCLADPRPGRGRAPRQEERLYTFRHAPSPPQSAQISVNCGRRCPPASAGSSVALGSASLSVMSHLDPRVVRHPVRLMALLLAAVIVAAAAGHGWVPPDRRAREHQNHPGPQPRHHLTQPGCPSPGRVARRDGVSATAPRCPSAGRSLLKATMTIAASIDVAVPAGMLVFAGLGPGPAVRRGGSGPGRPSPRPAPRAGRGRAARRIAAAAAAGHRPARRPVHRPARSAARLATITIGLTAAVLAVVLDAQSCASC